MTNNAGNMDSEAKHHSHGPFCGCKEFKEISPVSVSVEHYACWKRIEELEKESKTWFDVYQMVKKELAAMESLLKKRTEALEKINKHCHGDAVVYSRMALQDDGNGEG